MKKFFLLSVFALCLTSFSSCTITEELDDETTQAEGEPPSNVIIIDPEKDCPPNDRNCNGIPDDQE